MSRGYDPVSDRLRRLRRVQWGVRAALGLGIAASIAGNVVHARPDLTARLISGWSPVALMISIEILARVPVHRRSLAILGRLVTGAVAAIAGVISYSHLVALAVRYGETSTNAHLLPFSVDGMIVLASIALLEVGGQVRAATGYDEPDVATIVAVSADIPTAVTAPAEVAAAATTNPTISAEKISTPRRRRPVKPPRGEGRTEVARAYSSIPADDPRTKTQIFNDIASDLALSPATVKTYVSDLPAPAAEVAAANGTAVTVP